MPYLQCPFWCYHHWTLVLISLYFQDHSFIKKFEDKDLDLGILLAAKSVNNEDEDKDAIEAAEARGSCSGNPHHIFPVSSFHYQPISSSFIQPSNFSMKFQFLFSLHNSLLLSALECGARVDMGQRIQQ